MTGVQRIRKEYGSFRAAVEHYAGMGCSRTLTAKQLEIDRGAMRKLVMHYDLDGLFKPRKEMVPECRRGNPDRGKDGRFVCGAAEKPLQNSA